MSRLARPVFALTLALTLALALAPALTPGRAYAAAKKPAKAPAEAPAAAAPAGPARLAPPEPLAGSEVLVSADRLERDGAARTVTGEGAVTVRHHELRLIADRAVYNEETKYIVADGNVVLDSGNDRLQGEHLELNLETRVGFLEHAQGFVQTYYLTGERIEKRGPDRYYIQGGSFTTCEGTMPDWSFRSTSTELTIDEYLHAWNPTLRVKKVPVLYFPYAVFPIKRDRSTGLLIPTVAVTGTDGFVLRNAFYWAPRDNFDATIGLDYLQKTGWGARAEARYLFAPRTQGVAEAYYLKNDSLDSERWAFSTRNSQELPYGLHAEIEAFTQSDRQFIQNRGQTIEQRSSERMTSSIYINRRWDSWDLALSGRYEESLLTESTSTLTRLPELTIDRTSSRVLDTDLFLKIASSAAKLQRKESDVEVDTTRLHLSPEVTWPVSIGTAARLIPSAGYALTYYSLDLAGKPDTRGLGFYSLTLEGPRPYRIWDLAGGGGIEKIKHLIEPRVSYVYTPRVAQANLPQFDSIDFYAPTNHIEYSLTNTVFAKERLGGRPGATALPGVPPPGVAADGTRGNFPAMLAVVGDEGPEPEPGAPPYALPEPEPEEGGPPGARFTTSELFWVKLSQSYTVDAELLAGTTRRFTPVEWDARSRPSPRLSLSWRGNVDVYGAGIGYQNVSTTWQAADFLNVNLDWRSNRDSTQDFIDVGANLALGILGIDLRSRYNLSEDSFVENRIDVKYTAQCWDVTVGYVRWPDEYQYVLQISLKGVGTVIKI
jgi:LPS-assembly protein